MISVAGKEYIQFLYEKNLLEEIVSYLYDCQTSSIKQKTLTPIDWVELKLSQIKKSALENDIALVSSK